MKTDTRTHKSVPIEHEPSTQPVLDSAPLLQDFTMEMLKNDDALQLLKDGLFKASWNTLYSSCPWHSVFQHKSFVLAWYKHYAAQYMPLVIKAVQGDRLVGLLTLARNPEAKVIQVAGFREAHYQVWLAEPAYGNSFIKEGIKLLYREFPQDEINFYNTPPHTPLDWLKDLPAWRHPHTLRSFERPLMHLKEPGYVSGTLNSRRFRKRLNQLRKLGDLQFEHVTCDGQFAEAIEEMAVQFDFRKAAKYNWTEFRCDPLKKPFLIDLFREGILHVSLLKLNGQIIASLVDTIGSDNWMHGTEVSTYSSFHAKHSPGMLCFMLLGQHLASAGYDVYDLTPGSDDYKKRLANGHDYVHELRFTPSVKSLLLRKSELKLRYVAGNLLKRTHINPKTVLENMRRLSYQARSLNKLFHFIYGAPVTAASGNRYTLHPISAQPGHQPESTMVKAGSLQDLLDYSPQKNDAPRWSFLTKAMEFIEDECIPYTHSSDGQLKFCCWHIKSHDTALKIYPELPADTEILYGVYYQNISLQFVQELLMHSAQQVVSKKDKSVLLILSDKHLATHLHNLCYQ